MNIFEALRQSHDIQRHLCDQIEQTRGDTPERQALFEHLKQELAAHATAEERFFYVPLMQKEGGIDLSRHAIAEHHELDELVEKVAQADSSTSAWLVYAKQLTEEVRHHLQEEERKFFQMAGKLLNEQEKQQLASDYLQELAAQKAA